MAQAVDECAPHELARLSIALERVDRLDPASTDTPDTSQDDHAATVQVMAAIATQLLNLGPASAWVRLHRWAGRDLDLSVLDIPGADKERQAATRIHHRQTTTSDPAVVPDKPATAQPDHAVDRTRRASATRLAVTPLVTSPVTIADLEHATRPTSGRGLSIR